MNNPTPHAAIVDTAAITTFCTMLFAGTSGYAAIRLLPEKGGAKLKPSTPFEPVGSDLGGTVIRHVRHAVETGLGAFILPGTVAKPGSARSADVSQLTVIVVDLDEGDIAAKRDHLARHLGDPTLEVTSGGLSADGQLRRHLYWQLDTPASAEAITTVCDLRRAIALKVGGDPAFGSPHQPIRIAGSCNRKGGGSVPVQIVAQTNRRVTITGFAAAVEAMPPLDTGGPDASPDGAARAGKPSAADLLDCTIRQGGVDGITRFEAVSTIIGTHIRKARRSKIGMENAWQAAVDYNALHLDPPLPTEELRQHFNRLRQVDARNHGSGSKTKGSTTSLSGTPDIPDGTEDALAERFTRQQGEDWRFCVARGIWFYWNGRHWQPDQLGLVRNIIRMVCRSVAADAIADGQDRLARQIAAERAVSAVERLTRSDPRHATAGDAWDADPMLLNTQGGVLNLKTGKLSPHRRSELMTRISPAAPAGQCPIWMKFLHQVTGGDMVLQAYLQRVAGYCLTGVTTEQVFLFLYGPGANGKSVFLAALGDVLGDYATPASLDAFMASHSDRHPVDLADLQGARLAMVGETEANRAWAETRIKTVTGGDSLKVRHLYRSFFILVPTFKIIIAGNHRPSFNDTGEAMRRRVHLVPFPIIIPPEDRDKDLQAKLATERNGILAWALEGCLDWQRQGLAPPEAVREATEEYFRDEDQIGQWLAECCIKDPKARTAAGQLFASYEDWAEQAGEEPFKRKAFSQALKSRGHQLARGRFRTISGLRLGASAPPEAEG